jgi:hypothetical protein
MLSPDELRIDMSRKDIQTLRQSAIHLSHEFFRATSEDSSTSAHSLPILFPWQVHGLSLCAVED